MCTGDVDFLVSSTHPDSSLALGGSRDLARRTRRQAVHFKESKVRHINIIHQRSINVAVVAMFKESIVQHVSVLVGNATVVEADIGNTPPPTHTHTHPYTPIHTHTTIPTRPRPHPRTLARTHTLFLTTHF
jgi:hypothetical protein